jgi:hypothetical protein
MTLRTRIRLLLPILAMAAVVSFAGAQQPATTVNIQTAPLGQTIPVDPLITVGTLPNGLRYYVRENKLPQARAELRLVVKAGSVLEDEDQLGLAHFVEHMAFNGTLNFPKQEITNFMQSLGMRFGAHVNAHTSFDETVYELQIPTGHPGVIDRSLTILEDFARNVSFDSVEIDKERGVILEEWRLGLGADERMQDAQFPILLKGSRYADRLPIGKPDIIRNVNHDRLKQFYADWYRPDLLAVVAVGDFDKAAVEAQIKSRFGGIPASASPKPRPDYGVPEQPGTMYSVVTDPEATRTTISVETKMPARDQSTVGAYRQQMVERLFSGMLSARFDEMTQQPNAPFLAAQTGRGIFVRTAEVTSLSALVAQGGVERGRSRRALWVHRDGAGSAGAQSPAVSGECGHREKHEPVGAARRRVHQELPPGRTDSGHCVRVRVESAFPTTNHACRIECTCEGMGARSQPRRRDQRAGERSGDVAGRGEDDGRDRVGQPSTADRVRRYRQHEAAARTDPFTGTHCDHLDERIARAHRVAVIQWRSRRAKAHDVQGGRDLISSREPWRDVHGERS